MKIALSLTLFIVAAASRAAAQVYVPAVPNNYFNTVIQGNMQTLDLSQRLFNARQALRSGRGASTSSANNAVAAKRPAAVTGAAGRSTTFRPVAASIVPQQIAAQAAKTPEEREQMQTFFTQCLQSYERNMRERGFPVKDVARAVSYFIGVNYNIIQGRAMSQIQAQALRTQINTALSNDAEFQASTDKNKQTIYETMAVLAEYTAISAAVGEDKNNRELVNMARSFAKENLEKLLGVSASRIKVTGDGLEF